MINLERVEGDKQCADFDCRHGCRRGRRPDLYRHCLQCPDVPGISAETIPGPDGTLPQLLHRPRPRPRRKWLSAADGNVYALITSGNLIKWLGSAAATNAGPVLASFDAS